jgi:hypothetical protein
MAALFFYSIPKRIATTRRVSGLMTGIQFSKNVSGTCGVVRAQVGQSKREADAGR